MAQRSGLEALQRITEAILAMDRDWEITHANAAATRLIGRPAEELVGHPLWEVVPGLVGTEFEHRHRAALASGEAAEFEAQLEEGGRWYSVHLYPSETGVTTCFGDATTLHVALEELAERGRRQQALAQFSYRCLLAKSVDQVLSDAAFTVAEVLDVPVVQVWGRAVSGAPVELVVEADRNGGRPVSHRSGAARFVIPGTDEAELVVHSADGVGLSRDAGNFVEAMVAMISGATQHIEDTERLQHLALHSQITNLPNRRFLIEHLSRLLEDVDPAGPGVALVAVEIARKWIVTTTYGPRAGDAITVALAERLRRLAESGAMLAHTPGDNLVLVIGEPTGDLAPGALITRIQAAMREPISVPTGEYFLTLRFGIAFGQRGVRAEEVLWNAETALQQARPPANVAMFGEAARLAAGRQASIDQDLHGAVARSEFRVFFQPIIDLDTGKPSIVEALVRWEHPDRGLVAPDEFIPVAEDNGLIIELGEWVLTQACQQAAIWQQRYGVPLRVSVNVSPRQIADPEFGRGAEAAAARSGLLPGTLKLEITERMLMDEAAQPRTVLQDLRRRGIRIAIDDFGTGYSSLSYLRRLEVDSLKIDRSFVAGLRGDPDRTIIEAIIRMAHAVGITTIAEGVEEVEQAAVLRQLGCDRAQGFLYSPPLPVDELEPFLRAAFG